MARKLSENRPSLALLRGKTDPALYAQFAAEFAGGNDALAARYALALDRFLGPAPDRDQAEWQSYVGQLSPHTRAAYAYALEEFFEWLGAKYGRVIAPHDVLTRDVEDYANWLATRPFSLEVERLRDGDQPERLAIFETVSRIGSADIRSIGAALPANVKSAHQAEGSLDMGWLAFELGRMVLHDALVRSPTLEELRADYPRAGIDVFVIPVPAPDGTSRNVPIEEIFVYRVPEPKPVSRTTIAARLAALSSFWDVLAEGENVAGGEPLVKHNIVKPIKKRISRGISADRRAARRGQKTSAETVAKLLRAADAATTLSEKRDRALVYFLVFAAVRVDEARRIRRGRPPASEEGRWPGWYEGGDPPTVVVMRKGGRRAELPYPPIALGPLADFQKALSARAAPDRAQYSDPAGKSFIEPDSPRWRYRDLTIMPDAPLFPAVSFWGANSTYNYSEFKPNIPGSYGGTDFRRPITRHGVTKLLGRLAERAGLSAEERQTVHPHALRHFAATAMGQGGKDIREIQAMLGHSSIVTTEGYLEEIEAAPQLSGQAEILAALSAVEPARAPAAARPAPTAPRAKVVDTTAQALPEEPPLPPEIEAVERSVETPPAVERLPPNRLAQAPINEDPSRVHLTEGEPIVEVHGGEEPLAAALSRQWQSAGSPDEVYEALEPDSSLPREQIAFTILQNRISPRKGVLEKGLTLETKDKKGAKVELVQKNMWLLDHYDPWPSHYGIGMNSVLTWYAKGSASLDGTVKLSVYDPKTKKTRSAEVPPLPVFAPEQVYPETGGRMLTFVEALYNRWLTGTETEPPSPTKTYGLVRWYAFFAMATARLERFLDDQKDAHPLKANRPSWVPFDAVGEIGKNIRAHKDEWLEAWLEKNAHTYTTTYKAFEKVPRGRGEESDKFWETFALASFEGAMPMAQGSPLDEIPSWFASEDPIRELWEQSPDKWRAFVTWLENVTGKKLTRERDRERSEQEKFAEKDQAAKRQQAEALLDEYWRLVDRIGLLETNLRTGANEDEAAEYGERRERVEEVGNAKMQIDEWLAPTLKKLGVDPDKYRDLPRKERRVRLLAEAFPGEPDLADPNMLAGSALFDPRLFSIDTERHTIVHDAEFRLEFNARYGRDSEDVVRRAARAMWEHVDGAELPEDKRARADRYSVLYSVFLSYLAWVVPGPKEMEARMAERGEHATGGAESRRQWLTTFVGALRDAVYVPASAEGIETEDELVDYIIKEQSLDRASAEDVLRSMKIQLAMRAEIEALPVERQIGAEIGGEAATMRVRGKRRKTPAAEQQTEAPPGTVVLKPGIVKRKGQLIPNAPRPVFIFVAGEVCESWYASVRLPDDGEFTANARGAVYLSPGAWASFRKNAEPIESAMPSVFRMVAAMAEGDGL